jgi:cyanophycin synthetase
LLLIFADALVRSWKQITKFKASAGPVPKSDMRSAATRASTPAPIAESAGNGAGAGGHANPGAPMAAEAVAAFSLEGLIRDERGIRMAPEIDD